MNTGCVHGPGEGWQTSPVTHLRDVFTAVLLELLLEGVDLGHHLLGVLPAEVLLLELHHDQQGRGHQVHPRRRLRVSFFRGFFEETGVNFSTRGRRSPKLRRVTERFRREGLFSKVNPDNVNEARSGTRSG